MLGGGLQWEEMSLRQRLDFAEAALLEPWLHGSMVSVDELLDSVAQEIASKNPDQRTWGQAPDFEEAHPPAEPASTITGDDGRR